MIEWTVKLLFRPYTRLGKVKAKTSSGAIAHARIQFGKKHGPSRLMVETFDPRYIPEVIEHEPEVAVVEA